MLSARFPHKPVYQFGAQEVSAERVLSLMGEYLTKDRQTRIENVVAGRTCNVVPVLENIYDRGNISAVLRSAEAMGYGFAHVIEFNEKFKNANRVSQGADKWVDVQRWKSTLDCTKELKRQGFQILATHLDANARPISEIDVTGPTAIVFGNEKDGISQEMIEAADQTVIIPMQGFVQSFNISVAAAISLYHIFMERVRKQGAQGDLSEREKLILQAEYSLRSSKNPERLLEEIVSRKL